MASSCNVYSLFHDATGYRIASTLYQTSKLCKLSYLFQIEEGSDRKGRKKDKTRNDKDSVEEGEKKKKRKKKPEDEPGMDDLEKFLADEKYEAF